MTPDLLEHLPGVARRVDLATDVLLGLDFDGTLAHIRPTPGEAALTEANRRTLARIAGLPGVTVMIVSGRGLADVAERVGFPDFLYAGNHGLEINGHGLAFLEPRSAALVPALQGLTSTIEKRLAAVPGARVEPKGLTASVHYRNVPPERWDEVAAAVREVVDTDAERFVLRSGHRVWEVRPRVSWHKGQAIDWVLSQQGSAAGRLVFYLGDDRTDEDAFETLPDAVTAKVGDPSTPTAARYRLADPAAVEKFLDWLADELTGRFPPNPSSGTGADAPSRSK